ncbi:MAG TPA: hypothetical protein VGF93_07070, partial [Solirubrobacteraceae bacterium]
MGQRSRKRGQRQKPVATAPSPAQPAGRRRTSEERNAAVRATLAPYTRGERPWVVSVGAVLALLTGGVQLILYLAGVKLSVGDTRP